VDKAVRLCQLGDIPDGGVKGVGTGHGAEALDLILLRHGEKVTAYENRCPHQGTPLETFPDKFLDASGELLVCSTHGARFRVSDGVCVEGPCKGRGLKPLCVHVNGGNVVLSSKPPLRRV